MKGQQNAMSRREFIRRLGMGAGSAMALMALEPLELLAGEKSPTSTPPPIRMTYRVQHGSGEQISLLGFGMMRLPNDQDEVNRLVDYAIEHGVNYFDTAPIYMDGESEVLTGNALSRHPREKFFVATKMSNMWGDTSLEKAKEMYQTSMRKLRVDHIDYYLLHGIGGGGMESFNRRFIENGLLDYLLKEREAGRIKHLGWSYHGDVRVFDWLLDHQDEYHWDFCQIQMNFLDWRHASLRKGRRGGDADAEYLYNKCEKAGVQCVIMEPLRGGSFGRMAQELSDQLKAVRPDDSTARWAFRWVGSFPNILTTLSGMNRMDHLEENVQTFSPLDPCTEKENKLLAEIADQMAGFPTIPCTTCAYCMPCPYGVDIPGNFAYYNQAVTDHVLPLPDATDADYAARKQQFIDGYRRALPDEKTWASQCQDCEVCLSKCPQQIRIPNQMARIVETLRRR
ncbi:MAG: aldo/keto reductase [Prevotella sp.]|nr:aldo/keto reductase [Prevotella sp.]